jgi:hypothetical protein
MKYRTRPTLTGGRETGNCLIVHKGGTVNIDNGESRQAVRHSSGDPPD